MKLLRHKNTVVMLGFNPKFWILGLYKVGNVVEKPAGVIVSIYFFFLPTLYIAFHKVYKKQRQLPRRRR